MQIVADGAHGGGTTFVLELIKSLDHPLLITQKDSYALSVSGEIPKWGINFMRFPFDLSTLLQLKRILAEAKPDLIHLHGGRAAFFFSFIKAPCPVMLTVHGLHSIYGKKFLSRYSYRRSFRHLEALVFVSHFEEEVALNNDLIRGAHHLVIHNGIDESALPPREGIRKKLLGFAGRLSPVKDPLFLLKVMELLGPKGYHLKVVGGGELEMKMRKSPYVTLTGALPRFEALKELATIEKLLVPSVWEACALLPLEAMAMGIPVIASRIPAFEEVLKEHAELIDQKDPQLWASAILRGEDRSEGAKEYFLKHYRWESCMRSYHHLYSELYLATHSKIKLGKS